MTPRSAASMMNVSAWGVQMWGLGGCAPHFYPLQPRPSSTSYPPQLGLNRPSWLGALQAQVPDTERWVLRGLAFTMAPSSLDTPGGCLEDAV